MNLKKLHKYLCDLNTFTHPDALLLAGLVKVSQVAGINKVCVKSSIIDTQSQQTPANIYGITFLNSGAGKDKPLRDINKNLIPYIIDDFEKRAATYRENKSNHVKQEANEKFGEKANAEKNKWISQNSPRFLPIEMSDATLEGFLAIRKSFEGAYFGSTFLRISEFGDYITSDNTARSEFLSMISEVFDYGDSSPKIIKGEKEAEGVSGVASSAIMHTSPAYLLDGINRTKLFTFLDRGLARRSFICYPGDVLLETNNPDVLKEIVSSARVRAEDLVPDLKNAFLSMYENTMNKYDDNEDLSILTDTQVKNVFTLTTEADDRISEYQIENQIHASSLPDSWDKAGIRSERANRHWKALKLSGVIACFEHPKDKSVTLDDVEEAIRITNMYGDQMAKFYSAKPTDAVDALFSYMYMRKETWVSTMDIRDQNFVDHRQFAKWIEESMTYVDQKAYVVSYVLEYGKHGRSGKKYRLMPLTKEDEKESTIVVSQASSNDLHEVIMKPKTIVFNEIHKITGEDKLWSPFTYKDNYRKDINVIGDVSLVVLDVDSGMTMKECSDRLKEYDVTFFIHTTKSHGVKKGNAPACDRYRVVLPIHRSIKLSKDEFSQKVQAVSLYFGITIDNNAKNISRVWRGNSKQEYEYHYGGYIDLSVFTLPERKKTTYVKASPHDASGVVSYRIKKWEEFGGRNSTLYGIRRHLEEEGFDKTKIDEIIKDANEQFQEPLPERELQFILRSR